MYILYLYIRLITICRVHIEISINTFTFNIDILIYLEISVMAYYFILMYDFGVLYHLVYYENIKYYFCLFHFV
ncbi:hypothetical protein PFUGPA_00700 [Plasmodium falciparum Palo Alto/Uganda]|uniref:Uncharacterized protein n=1 Tax=Plasmodium falciparum (isolate Palo Alto / Uganda) TaxID=57270 RepID=W4J4I3_PLAFP|nr:hypothetical protein PFUGPA_00700 [Plasmodium falciparum Palo Alto/Uganda]